MRFFKYCAVCDEKFRPTGKSGKMCESCSTRPRKGKSGLPKRNIYKGVSMNKVMVGKRKQKAFEKEAAILADKYGRKLINSFTLNYTQFANEIYKLIHRMEMYEDGNK